MTRPVLRTERLWLVPLTLGMRHVRTYQVAWDDPLSGSEHGEVVYEVTRDAWRAGRG